MKRRKLSKKKSRKIFTKGAVNVKSVISVLAQCAVVSGFKWLVIIRLIAGVFRTPALNRVIVLCSVLLPRRLSEALNLVRSLVENVLDAVWHILGNGQSGVSMKRLCMIVIVF